MGSSVSTINIESDFKKYKTIKTLGVGTFAKVNLVKDNYNRKFAMRIIPIENKRLKLHTLNEIKSLENLSKYPDCNKYIVCYYRHWEDNKNINILQEYIEGKTLKEILEQEN